MDSILSRTTHTQCPMLGQWLFSAKILSDFAIFQSVTVTIICFTSILVTVFLKYRACTPGLNALRDK